MYRRRNTNRADPKPSGTPRSIPIPGGAWDGSSGSFTTTLNYTTGQSFILTMSDANGFGTGGNSDLLFVGSGVTNTQCNTTNLGAAFSFQVPSNIQQCGSYLFSGYDAATPREPSTSLHISSRG